MNVFRFLEQQISLARTKHKARKVVDSEGSLQLEVEKLEDRMMLSAEVGQIVFSADFEDANIERGGFGFVREVSGLTATTFPVEVQNNHPSVGPASQGEKHLELDGLNGVFAEVESASTAPLFLKFDYSARPGAAQAQNEIEIYWAGELLDTVSEDGKRLKKTDFREIEISLPTQSGRLEFRSSTPGEPAGLGGLLDNIVVFAEKVETPPPIIAPISDQVVTTNSQLDLTASLLPPNEAIPDAVFRLIDGPVGMTIDASTGQINWDATAENIESSDARNDTSFLSDPILEFESGFEDVPIAPGEFGFASEISGFKATRARFEIQNNHPAVGPASEGNQHLELDGLNGIFREISTIAGDQYELVFDYSPRTGETADGNRIEVLWDGEIIGEVAKDGTRNRSTQFEEYRFDVSDFSGDLTRLEFRSNDLNEKFGIGGLLDNVRLFRRTLEEVDGPDGKYNVVIEVANGEGQTDRESFKVCIEDVVENALPTLDPINDQNVTAGETVVLKASANDPDGDPVTFSLGSDAPDGATIDPTTGEFTWTPTSDDIGTTSIVILVSDGKGGEVSAEFAVEVVAVNLPPTIDSIADRSVVAGQSVDLLVTASDPESAELTFSLGSGSPVDATIDPTTGRFSLPTDRDDIGEEVSITVVVTDDQGETASTEFNISVVADNGAPLIDPIASQSVAEDALLELTVMATDPGALPLTYTVSGSTEGAATIDSSGVFRFAPTELDGPGIYAFEVTVSNGTSESTTTFQVNVLEVNVAPELIVPDLVADGDVTLDISSVLNLDFAATDSDLPANELLFSLEDPVSGATINPDTGQFSYVASQDLIDETVDFVVIVEDAEGLTGRHEFSVTIESCPFDDALTGWMVQETGGSAGDAGSVTAQNCIATLTEGDSFVVSLDQTFVIQQNRAIEFTFDNLNFDTTDDDFVNDAFEVALLDSNGQSLIDTFASGSDAFFNISEGLDVETGQGITIDGNTVTVGLNGLPVGEEATLVFRLVNNDDDTDSAVQITKFAIVDSFAAAAVAAPLSQLAAAGSIESPIQRTSEESTVLPTTVSAGQGQVGEVIGEPLITARIPNGEIPVGSQVVLTGDAIAQGVQSNGQANQIVSVIINGSPVEQLDASGNFFSSVSILPGTNEFIFKATDVTGLTTQAVLSILGTQSESEINFNQFTDITQSLEGVYAQTSFDDANSTLLVDLAAANDGTFNADGPLLVGVENISDPTVSLIGFDGVTPDGTPYFDFSDLLTDEALASGEQTDSKTIRFFNPLEIQFDYDLVFLAQTNEPPVIISTPVIEAYYDNDYSYDVEATDANDDELTFALTLESPGMTIDAATGVITWSPTINDYGLHDIAVEVSDGRGGKAEQRFTINVTEAPPNRPPIIVSTPVTSATIGAEAAEEPETIASDLRNWEPRAYDLDGAGFANWVINNDGTTAVQTLNADPSFLLSDFVLENDRVSGAFESTTLDDDFIGFVFGYQNERQFYLFDWKQGTQDGFGLNGEAFGLALQGMSLKRFDSDRDLTQNDFWATETVDDQVELLFHNDTIYEDDVEYGFQLDFRPGRIEIVITQGDEVLETIAVNDSAFTTGRFGFYNNSQNDVTYRGFETKRIAPITYQYEVKALDADQDDLSYRLTEAPLGMTIGNDDGTISWGPTRDQLSTETLVFQSTFEDVDVQAGTFGVFTEASGFQATGESIEIQNNSPSVGPSSEGNQHLELDELFGIFRDVETVEGNFYELVLDFSPRPNATVNDNRIEILWDGELIETITGDGVGLTTTAWEEYRFDLSNFSGDLNRLEIRSAANDDTFGIGGLVDNIRLYQTTFNGADHRVTVEVSDGNGGVTEQSFIVCVRPDRDGQFTITTSAPVITSQPPNTDVTVGQPWQYEVAAEDAEGGSIEWTLASAPDGMSLNTRTILNAAGQEEVITRVQWDNPPGLFAGNTQTVTLNAVDAEGNLTTQSFDLTVSETRASEVPPTIVSTAPTAARVGKTWSYQLQATDANGDPLTYQLNQSPAGMAITETGLVTWTPDSSANISNTIEVAVLDGQGSQTTQTFELNIVSQFVNDPPVITSVPRVTATTDFLYQYDAVATDLDGDVVTWDLESAPVGMSIDSESGQIRWLPNEEQLGNFRVVLTVTDAAGETATQRFQINVGCNNHSPAIVSVPPTAALTSRAYFYAPRATDVEGDTLTWSLSTTVDGMTIDAETGFVRWNPTTAQIGPHNITIEVSDGTSTAKQSYSVIVSSADDLVDPSDPSKGTKGNRAPLITSTPDTGATIEALYQYQVEAVDLDGHAFSYRLINAPDGMEINENGLITYNPTAADEGVVAVNIQVVDEFGAIASQGYRLDVRFNSAPVIESEPATSVIFGQTYRYSVNAIDAEGDSLSYELLDGPDGMTIDPQIGYVSWSTFQNPAPAGSTQAVSIKVSDAFGNETTQNWQIEVVEDTVAPSVAISVVARRSVFRGAAVEFPITPYRVSINAYDNVRVTDLKLTINGTDVALDSRGQAFITPIESGQYRLVATVTDSAGLISTDEMVLDLLNEAPEIISVPSPYAILGEDYEYQVVAEDAEDNDIVYSIIDAPVGMEIDAISGAVTWAADLVQAGQQTVTVAATDEFGASKEQTYSLQAFDTSVNVAPIFVTTPTTTVVRIGEAFRYFFEAIDLNGDEITYSLLDGSPSELDFGVSTRSLRFAPTEVGETTRTIQADDGNGGISTQTITIAVREQNRRPFFVSRPPTRVLAGTEFAYKPIVVDPDGDEPVLFLTEGVEESLITSFVRVPAFDEDMVLRWQTNADDVGSYEIVLNATDAFGFDQIYGSNRALTRQVFTIEVVEDLSAPSVEILSTPNPALVGDTIDVQLIASDDGTIEQLGLTFDGQVVELNDEGQGSFIATSTGFFDLVATVTDDEGNTSERETVLQVRDNSDFDSPVVEIESPADGTTITTLADIVGTVTDDNLVYYSLAYAPVETGQFVEFFRSDSSVESGVLGTFDPTTLANGNYDIRLLAVDANGRTSVARTQVEVSGELKLGNFQLSFVDMSIPIGALPIVVGRSYDSLNANQQGEFGYGWRLEFRDTDLRTSVAPSGQEDLGFSRPFKDGSRVFLTLPGGQREGFTFKVELAPGLRGQLGIHYGSFVPDDGVTTQLSVKQFELAFDSQQNVYTWGTSQAYNPTNSIFGGKFYATTDEGIFYEINGATGDLERVIDGNGNTITFSNDAIESSSGQKIDIIRDDRGRISQIVDPAGNAVSYGYDNKGDLVSFTDREGNVTTFDYDAPRPHYLTEITDPLGRSGIRTEYDESGKLVKLIDADGNVTELIHDPDNFIEQVVDPLGNVTTYEYDERGNVLKEIDALGGETSYTYDINNNELTVTDALGNTTEFTYNSTGDVLSETDALGNTTSFEYRNIQPKVSLGGVSISGFLKPFSVQTTQTDANGNQLGRGYDIDGNLVSMTNGAGETNTFDLVGGLPVSVSRAGINQSTFEYNANGLLTRSTDAFGRTNDVTYGSNGEVLTETSTETLADGSTVNIKTENQYDSEGRLRFVRVYENDVLVTEVESRFDAIGNLVERIDALGRSTKFIFDERGLLVESILPDGTPDDADNPRSRSEYDALGQQTALIDELGRRTEFVYDALGRLVETILPDATPSDNSDNPRTKVEFDLAGQQVATIDERGNRTEYVYDAAGRQIATILPDETPEDLTDNPRAENNFDAAGRLIEQIDPRGNKTAFQYDTAGRVIKTTFADGTTAETVYDSQGLRTAQIDQNGVRTEFEYSNEGQLIAVVSAEVMNADGTKVRPRTEYEYDNRGNQLVQRDALGAETKFEYDGMGRKIATELAEGQFDSSEYDNVGRLVTQTDFNGDATTLNYDERDRVVLRTLADGSELTYTYLANGLTKSVTDARGTTTYEYDARNRLILQVNPDQTMLEYGYDAAGNRTSVTSLAGTTTYTFDAQNRMTSVTDPDGDVTAYVFDSMGLVETRFSNGVTETREYDSLNRLVYLENASSISVLSSFAYTLDANGNRLSVVEAGGRRIDYQYDSLYRLTDETITDPVNGDRTISYEYDLVGNRLVRDDSAEGITSYVYDANGRLLTETTTGSVTSYSYDANGNTQTVSVDGNVVTRYEWDKLNRLVALDENGDGTADSTFAYDFQGNRIEQVSESEVTKFLVDSNRQYANVLEEYTPSGVIKVSYVHGIDLISQNRNIVGGAKSIYGVDGLGSTRILTDSNGLVTDSYRYDAFGKLLDTAGSTPNQFLFAGEQSGGSGRSELYYLRARYLNPATGRFISRDPAPFDQLRPLTANRFSYVENNPANLIDPSGLTSVVELSTAQAIGDIIVGQAAFTSAALGYSTAAGDIVQSNLIVVNISLSKAQLTFYVAKTDSIRGGKEYAIGGLLLGFGDNRGDGSGSGIEVSTDTAFSPGFFFYYPSTIGLAFTGIFDFASVGYNVGPVGQGFGGGFLGFSVVDQSGRSFGTDTNLFGASASVVAGLALPPSVEQCGNGTSLGFCEFVGQVSLGGFTNQQLIGIPIGLGAFLGS